MRRSLGLLAASLMLAWSGAAWAITQKTEIVITDKDGTPVKNQEVTLKVHTTKTSNKAEKPRQISETKQKTDEDGKLTFTYDDEDLKRGAAVDFLWATKHGSK